MYKYFQSKDPDLVNEIKVELYNTIKIDICGGKKIVWLSNQPQFTSIDQLRSAIKFSDISDLNDKLVESVEKETMDLKFYKNMLEFTYNKVLIVDQADLSKIVKTGIFTD